MAKEATARNLAAENRGSVAATRSEAHVAETVKEATALPPEHLRTADGGKGAGPKSALKGGVGSKGEGPTGMEGTKSLAYSVQVNTDEKGLEVFEPIEAESGDEAAQKALAKKNYVGASIRGVTPYSDPDPNSLGGERDAAIMIANSKNGGSIINSLGTEANAKAVEELGKADIKELGE